jgi:hypothetical protein
MCFLIRRIHFCSICVSNYILFWRFSVAMSASFPVVLVQCDFPQAFRAHCEIVPSFDHGAEYSEALAT